MPDSRALPPVFSSAPDGAGADGAGADGVEALGELVAGLGVATPELAGLLVRLRETVARYVAERRADGACLERVLPEVRCIVREAESADGGFAASEALMRQVLRWAAAAYDDAPGVRRTAPLC
jgi:hypothetical protein